MADGLVRCGWVVETPGDPLYRDYHDEEWGRPLHGRDELFERLALEAFQSGLSWITILRKREAFREAFDGFDPDKVAAYASCGCGDDCSPTPRSSAIARRSRRRFRNARVLVNSPDLDLDSLLWSFSPPRRTRRLTSIARGSGGHSRVDCHG